MAFPDSSLIIIVGTQALCNAGSLYFGSTASGLGLGTCKVQSQIASCHDPNLAGHLLLHCIVLCLLPHEAGSDLELDYSLPWRYCEPESLDCAHRYLLG